MEYITLANGVKVPKLGFGVYQIPKETCEECVLKAIKNGYRHIDTAQAYFNEEEVGNAILKCGVDRKELFITTKIWIDNYGYKNAYESVIRSMQKLKVDYIDLVLLHQSYSDYYGAYKALIDLYKDKKIRAIGVSNFFPDRLVDLIEFTEIKPHINQIEINPFYQQKKAVEVNQKYWVQLEAWAPFGEGRNDMFNNPTLKAIGNKYNKSVAQVILRWLTQKDIIALAKSVNENRMIENINIFDFKLDENDIKTIESLDLNKSLFFDHNTADTVEFMVNLVEQRRNMK